ncbi:MAG: methyl-accepting chemotaxis protein [Bacillota bacterium]
MYQALNNIQELNTVSKEDPKYEELLGSFRENVSQVNERIANSKNALEKDRELWDKYTHAESGHKIFDNFSFISQTFNKWVKTSEDIIKSGNISTIYSTDYLKDFNSSREYMNQIGELVGVAIDNEVEASIDAKNSAIMTALILVLVGFISAAFISVVITGTINKSLRNAVNMISELGKGHLNERADVNSKDEIGQMVKSMNQFADHLQKNVVGVMKKISEGDLNTEIQIIDSNDEIGPSLKNTVESLQGLINETTKLTDAAAKGQLAVRGNLNGLKGAYSQIVKGINDTLDAVIEPINEAKTVLGRMASNDLTVEMSGKYNGTLNEFADDLNVVRTGLLSIQENLVKASKGDTSKLEDILKIGKRSENDKLTPALIAVYQSIQGIIDEVNMLTRSATEGNLDVRGSTDKFEGGYRTIIDGFNKTIDAIVEPIKEASSVLKEMADGNLQVSMKGNYNGDHAVIKNSLNLALDSFNEVLGDIRSSAAQVASGAQQMSGSSQVLSQGATEQASSIEEITASMEELSSQTKQNANNASQANSLAATAKESAIHGNIQMREMLKSMSEINDASSSISKIIKVIDEIAFQTNILALNAAVEAARAGQHGKGFAVVAEEVRNLAARSADAAKETTTMIESSIKKVEDGTKITNETAQALNNIVESVAKAADLVGEIATASNEQASGIAQINQSILQVSQVIQTNSATSEEAAAASEELSGQAELLNELVRKFRINKPSKNKENVGGVDPETLKLIESMKDDSISINSKDILVSKKNEKKNQKKILLNDNEFGKY